MVSNVVSLKLAVLNLELRAGLKFWIINSEDFYEIKPRSVSVYLGVAGWLFIGNGLEIILSYRDTLKLCVLLNFNYLITFSFLFTCSSMSRYLVGTNSKVPQSGTARSKAWM